jgi:hypothetical protein
MRFKGTVLRANIVLHRLVEGQAHCDTRYDYWRKGIVDIVEELEAPLAAYSARLGLFFDDGYESQGSFLGEWVRPPFVDVYLAIVCDWIGKDGYLSTSAISELKEVRNVQICSHGVQHVPLANYVGN